MSIAARSRDPIRRRASAIAPANAVYQVSVPKPTPTSSAAVLAEDPEPPKTAAGAAAVQSAIVSGLSAVAGKGGREGSPRRADFLGRLEPKARAKAEPDRPHAQRSEHTCPDKAERDARTVGGLERPRDAREPERRVAEVDERDCDRHCQSDPEVAAHDRANDQQRDRADLRRDEKAEAEADK